VKIKVTGYLKGKEVSKAGKPFQLYNEFDGRCLDEMNLTITFNSCDDFSFVENRIKDFLLIHKHCFKSAKQQQLK